MVVFMNMKKQQNIKFSYKCMRLVNRTYTLSVAALIRTPRASTI